MSFAAPKGRSTVFGFYERSGVLESNDLVYYLNEDVWHVRPGMPVDKQDAAAYYKGFDTGFGAVAASLDVRRAVGDTLLVDAVLSEETPERSAAELFVVKGAAGNGKTTILKRCAWDAANEYGALVLYLRDTGALRREPIKELYQNTRRRLFVLWIALLCTSKRFPRSWTSVPEAKSR